MAENDEPQSGFQSNGEMVLDALQDLVEPATLKDVVDHIAYRHNVIAASIKDPVKTVLNKGVEYGFIQKKGSRYSADGILGSPPCDRCFRTRPMAYSARRRSRTSRRKKSRRSRSRSRRRRK